MLLFREITEYLGLNIYNGFGFLLILIKYNFKTNQ